MEGTAQRAGFLGYYYFFSYHILFYLLLYAWSLKRIHPCEDIQHNRTVCDKLVLVYPAHNQCYAPPISTFSVSLLSSEMCFNFFCIFEIQRKFHGNLNIPKCSFFRPKYNRNEKFFSQKVFIRNSISSYLQLDLCTRLKTTILCMAENFAIDLEEPLPVILCRLWTF